MNDKEKNLVLRVTGGQIPSGEVRVSGAKNAATRLMAAALLTEERVVLSNFPTELVDVRHKGRFIASLGALVDYNQDESILEITAGSLSDVPLENYDYPIRTTYLLAAGQLARNGRARIPYPGGCKLGERKYDLHILTWERLGCQVQEKETFIEITAPKSGMHGAEIHFPITTIGGTENGLLCGVVAQGTTVIKNAYISPEVENLIEMLRKMGAAISVEGTSLIVIEGGRPLHGATVATIPDRIEALTWIIYASLSGGKVVIRDVPHDSMLIPLQHLKSSGIDFFKNSEAVFITPECFSSHGIQPFELACGTHPGIISDMQPFYVLLAMMARGRSLIVDYRYPKRVAYLSELSRFSSAALSWSVDSAATIRIDGPNKLLGAEVVSTDLRGSMALVLAALLAEGQSVVHQVGMALRGYNNLEQKLINLGIQFEVTNEL